jgi:hypothetical protein
MLPATVAECAQKGAANSLARFLERDDDFNQRPPDRAERATIRHPVL